MALSYGKLSGADWRANGRLNAPHLDWCAFYSFFVVSPWQFHAFYMSMWYCKNRWSTCGVWTNQRPTPCCTTQGETTKHYPDSSVWIAATDDEMERFYQDLSQAVKQVPKGDMLLVMGDLNTMAHWIQAPLTYLQSSHNHPTFISA